MNNYEYQVGGSLKMDALAMLERHVDSELYHAVADEFCCVFSSRQMGKSCGCALGIGFNKQALAVPLST